MSERIWLPLVFGPVLWLMTLLPMGVRVPVAAAICLVILLRPPSR